MWRPSLLPITWHSVPPASEAGCPRVTGPTRRSTMANPWFETVAEAQRRAKKRPPKGAYGALGARSQRGPTGDDNLPALAEPRLAPHTPRLPRERDKGGTLLGQPMSIPVPI